METKKDPRARLHSEKLSKKHIQKVQKIHTV